MLCGYPHNKIACPKCGSKAVRVSWLDDMNLKYRTTHLTQGWMAWSWLKEAKEKEEAAAECLHWLTWKCKKRTARLKNVGILFRANANWYQS
jgi:hypothetical protein